MRILVVEDSAVLRESLAQRLREAGYAVDAVGDGRRGLINAQTTDYDVIVLDWMLPEMNGLEILGRLRAKIEEHLYDDRSQVFSNAVDSAIAALRGKLEAAGCPPLIQTKRKVGYILSEAVS